MSETTTTTPPSAQPGGITLSDGRVIHLREPSAGELRGVKLLDVLQLDTAAHAPIIERISELSALEFYALMPADTMTLMTAVVSFFGPETAYPPA